jgi:hypothetical protein
MGAEIGSIGERNDPRPAGGWMAALVGRRSQPKAEGAAVGERLSAFVEPAVETPDASVDAVRTYTRDARVREVVSGACTIAQRLNAEAAEAEEAPLSEVGFGVGIFRAKMMQQRARRRGNG